MYIKKEDHGYFMGLFESLSEADKQKFLVVLGKTGEGRNGVAILRLRLSEYDSSDRQAIDLKEVITRTLLKKAYKSVKEDD